MLHMSLTDQTNRLYGFSWRALLHSQVLLGTLVMLPIILSITTYLDVFCMSCIVCHSRPAQALGVIVLPIIISIQYTRKAGSRVI
jgi:hypothetical protein